MILVDSSGWIEFLTDGRHASAIEKYLSSPDELLVPTLVMYEVYRQLVKKLEERESLLAVTQMEKGKVVPLDQEIALHAADLSLKHQLSTADAVIYATALGCGAKLVTLDNDFRRLSGCIVL